MPDVLTGRSRLLNITGATQFGLDPLIGPALPGQCRTDFNGAGGGNTVTRIIDPDTGLNVYWAPHVRLSYLGAVVDAFCSATWAIEYRGTDCVDREWRWVITLSMTLSRIPGNTPPDAPFTASHSGAWTPITQACDAYGVYETRQYGILLDLAEGSATLSESTRLTDYDQVSDTGTPLGGNKVEKSRCESFTLTASVFYQFRVTETFLHYRNSGVNPGGIPPAPPPGGWDLVVPPGGELGGGDTDPDFGGYSVCNGELAVNLNLGPGALIYSEPVGTANLVSLSEYERRAEYLRMGLNLDIAASLSYNNADLECVWATTPTCADGFATLTGAGWDGATYAWTGTDADWNGIPPGEDFGTPPAAEWRAFPSWALTLDADCFDYQDGGGENTDLDHRCFVFASGLSTPFWNLKLGQFTSNGSAYRYPSTGFAHTAQASVWDGDNPTPPVPVHLHEPLYHPKAADVPGGFVLTASNSASMFFAVNPDWAEATGRYPNSQQWPLGKPTTSHAVPRIFPIHLFAPFLQANMLFAATYQYAHFNSSAAWSVQGSAAFLAANPGHSTAATLSTVGGALQAVVTTPKVLARTSVPWKPFGHRYQFLRVKGDAAGRRLRVGIGDIDYLGAHWYPRWLWEFETFGINTYVSLPFDLLLPELSGGGAGGAVDQAPNTVPVHPQTWYPAGAPLWVEFLDAGTYTIDYVEGYYQTSGDRTPLTLLYPLDGRGELNPFYASNETPQALAATLIQSLKVFANGALMLTEGGSATIASYWALLASRLDSTANDTGIAVTVSAGDPMGNGYIHASEFTESRAGAPFGKRPAPGAVVPFQAQPRAQGLFGYYGMGSPQSLAYGMVNAFRGDWIWNGAVWGNTGAGSATPTLHDNPTGTLLDTQASDDDGYWELYGKYGVVWPYSNPRYLTPGPPGGPDLSDFGLAQWTTPGGVVTYTTLGNLLNSHWLKPGGLEGEVDGSGYLLVSGSGGQRFQVVILDRAHLFFEALAAGELFDLVTTLPAWHRTARLASDVTVQSTSDPGTEPWAVVGSIGEGAARDAFPTLAADRWDNLYAFYHTDLGVRAWRSGDWGATFEEITLPAAATGKTFPRAVITLDRQYLAWHETATGDLLLYGSDDFFETLELLVTVPGLDEQLADLGQDRRGRVYLGYIMPDKSYRQKTSDDAWAGFTVLLNPFHSKPSFDYCLPFGAHLAWEGETTLTAYQTDDSFQALTGTGTTVPGLAYRHFGLCTDRRDRLWMLARSAAGAFRVYWSDDGLTWTEIT